MSLASTWIVCDDGKWYKDPIWHGELLPDDTYPWFVCVDDDDPVELVVQKKQPWPNLPWFYESGKRKDSGERVFHSDWSFRPAMKVFGLFKQPPPSPQRYHGVRDKKTYEMQCFCDDPGRYYRRIMTRKVQSRSYRKSKEASEHGE